MRLRCSARSNAPRPPRHVPTRRFATSSGIVLDPRMTLWDRVPDLLTLEAFNIYAMQHTRVTGGLMLQMRNRFTEQNNLSAAPAKPSQHMELLTKTPSQSRQELLLPFSKDEALKQQYISPWQHIRLLEDLDAFAGLVAWTHADGPSLKAKPVTMVTASLDQLYLQRTITPDKDLLIEGYVNWVGTSSMEVQLEAYSQDAERKEECFKALFSMVALDSVTRRPCPVNRLVPETPAEKARYKRGEENKARRLATAATSLTVSAPTAEERFIIHDLFMKRKNTLAHHAMSASVQESLNVCQPQERNIANKIFGGYLMRKAAELAFSCAFMYARSQPHFIALDDITFLRPVEIGSLLKLRSQVIFCQANTLMVEIEATVHDPLKAEKHLTNRFYFTFNCPDHQGDLPLVMPQTYEEAMFFLEGKRKFERRIQASRMSAENIVV